MSDIYKNIGYDNDAHPIGFGKRAGVVVIDLQLAFTDPQYALGGLPLVERATENTAKLLEVARRCGVPVASCYTAYQSERDMPYWKVAAVYDHFLYGHRATELEPRIYDPDYDFKLCKSGASIFFRTPVETFFTRARVDTVIVTGCMTSGCIRASIIDSFQNGYRTIVPEDCVGDADERPHGDNLRDVGRRYADISSCEEVCAFLEESRGRNL